jgi:uncharacterized protein (TIGR02001 family)
MRTISKLAKAAAGAACATLLAGGAAQADDSAFSYYLTLTGASDYMFRGISYTDEDPTVNSYVEIDYDTKSLFGTAYIAFWTSNIDNGDYGPWEQDIYVGIRPVTGPINWDFAAWYYLYGARSGFSTWDFDYVEFKIGATVSPITNWTFGATVYLTPDQGLASTENISYEGTIAYTLPQMAMFSAIFSPTISGLVGHSDSGTNADYPDGYWLGEESYTYWNAGLKLTVEKFFMDFRYWDTTLNDGLADSRFVFSAGVNLLP